MIHGNHTPTPPDIAATPGRSTLLSAEEDATSKLPRVVIVGAGFAGMNAAKGLKNAPVSITLIDKNNHHLFQPLLYQVATATLSPADIASPIRSVLRNQNNVEVLLAEVKGVDSSKREVILGDRAVGYDYLILATGATHSYFGHNEWQPFAPGLKSIPDATEIRRRILLAFEAAEMEADLERRKTLLTFILVGGGPTGVEMAGAIAELAHRALASDFRRIDPRSARIVLIEADTRLLSSFPPDLSKEAALKLEALGVEVKTESRVEAIDESGVWISGHLLPSRTVIWTAGVRASPVGKWLNVETDRAGRVRVNPDLSVPHFPNIFVLGDAALVYGQNGKPLPGVAPVAMQQGKFIADALRNYVEDSAPIPAFRYWDKGSLATIGRSAAIAEIGRIHLKGVLAWLAWLVVHIYYLIGFRNRLLVLIEWAWSYISFARGARLIISKETNEDTRVS